AAAVAANAARRDLGRAARRAVLMTLLSWGAGAGTDRSDDLVLRRELAAAEAAERERLEGRVGRAVDDGGGDEVAHRRREHESVAAEPGGHPQAVEVRDRPENRLVVGRHVV